MTTADPELVTRLREQFAASGHAYGLLDEAADALEAAEARVQQLEAALKDVNDCRAALVGRADTQEPT